MEDLLEDLVHIPVLLGEGHVEVLDDLPDEVVVEGVLALGGLDHLADELAELLEEVRGVEDDLLLLVDCSVDLTETERVNQLTNDNHRELMKKMQLKFEFLQKQVRSPKETLYKPASIFHELPNTVQL